MPTKTIGHGEFEIDLASSSSENEGSVSGCTTAAVSTTAAGSVADTLSVAGESNCGEVGPSKRKKRKPRKGKRANKDPTGKSGTELCPVFWRWEDVPPENRHQVRWCIKKCGRLCHWRHMEPTKVTPYTNGAASRAGTSAEIEDLNKGYQYKDYINECYVCVAERDGTIYTISFNTFLYIIVIIYDYYHILLLLFSNMKAQESIFFGPFFVCLVVSYSLL